MLTGTAVDKYLKVLDFFLDFVRIIIIKPAKPTGREVNRFRQFNNN